MKATSKIRRRDLSSTNYRSPIPPNSSMLYEVIVSFFLLHLNASLILQTSLPVQLHLRKSPVPIVMSPMRYMKWVTSSQDRLPSFPLVADLPAYKNREENISPKPVVSPLIKQKMMIPRNSTLQRIWHLTLDENPSTKTRSIRYEQTRRYRC